MTSVSSLPARVSTRAIAELLSEARGRTLQLIAPLSDDDLRIQHDTLMSPILWDLGHIAHFEALWLTRNLDGPIEFVEMPGRYNPFEYPRAARGALTLPGLDEIETLMDDIRGRVLARLATANFAAPHPLLDEGYVYRLVAQHEYQHDETILQTLQLKQGAPYVPLVRHEPPAVKADAPVEPGRMVRFPGGRVTIGTDDRSAAYDNERPRHEVEVAPFFIDVTPVTNGEYLAFLEADGYADPDYWSSVGWAWVQASGARAPRYWSYDGRHWRTRSMDREGRIDLRHPVCHVNYHEAEAYARFAGKRLPTEIEWETAASWDPVTRSASPYPWGDFAPTQALANIDQLVFGTAPVWSYRRNVSPLGCYGMIGDVWEWTSTDFHGYPGFEAFPYPEYSEAFFGSEYKVLRGGSWATRPGAIRSTFRNWDYPIRRQIFSGVRCARDAS